MTNHTNKRAEENYEVTFRCVSLILVCVSFVEVYSSKNLIGLKLHKK